MKSKKLLFALSIACLWAYQISAQSIKVISPNGGENWTDCSNKSITWTQTNGSGYVYIDYSVNDGATWSNITFVSSPANTNGSYNWVVPNSATTKAKVRVRDYSTPTLSDTSDGSFSISSGNSNSLKLVSPNGGESLAGSSSKTITWTTVGTVANVTLRYSTNSGETWSSITSIANTGSYNWLVPTTTSTKCLFQLYDSNNPCIVDHSDDYFEINNNPAITVTQPTNGEAWYAGQSRQITWSSANLSSTYVTIEYSVNNGTSWNLITDKANNNRYYTWTVPNTPSTQALIRVKDFGAASVNGISQPFTIATPVIQILSPKGGESWFSQQSKTISWKNTGRASSYVRLDYSINNGADWLPIDTNYYDYYGYQYNYDGNYTWKVPAVVSSNALIRVTDKAYTASRGISDSVFSIGISGFTLLSPNGGESLASCSTTTITWNKTGASDNVKIDYTIDNGATWSNIINSYSSSGSSGSYAWLVPNTITTQAKIRIRDYTNPSIRDSSNAVFAITSGSTNTLSITSMNSGSYPAGSVQKITWETNGVLAGTYVNLEYSTDGGDSWNYLTQQTNTGTYNWTLPNTITTKALVRIYVSNNRCVTDQSNAYFSINNTPQLVVASPNGGEQWGVGQSKSISWQTTNVTSNYYRIEYSVNNGITWLPIDTNHYYYSNYTWTIPNTPTTQARIRVTNKGQVVATDVSDAAFTIQGPSIVVTAPNGGESLVGCTSQIISWKKKGTSDYFHIDYTVDNGATWHNIAQSVSGRDSVGTYSWNVPNSVTSLARIRIRDASVPTVRDSSDAVFSIASGSLTSLTLTSLNGGAYSTSSVQRITWTTTGTLSNNLVMLQYSTNGGQTWLSLTNQANTGFYDWTIPNVQSTQCLVRIYDYYNACIVDQSNSYFTINNNPNITITSPNGGESWGVGQVRRISWNSANLGSNYYKVEYSINNGSSWLPIDTNRYLTRYYDWTVPNTVTNKALIRVSSKGTSPVTSDISNAPFIIATPSFVLTSPNGAENWTGCSTQSITWAKSGTSGRVSLDYSIDNGITWYNIESNIENLDSVGTYDWKVANNATSLARVRIRDYTYPQVRDSSNATFTITSGGQNVLSLTRPNGGELLSVNAVDTIKWSTTGTLPNNYVRLDYSSDEGKTWNSITSLSNAGKYSWNVPNILTQKALVRVADYYNSCVVDHSNATFTITNDPVINVTSPNGGEQLIAGVESTIRWRSANLSAPYVKLEYSIDSGSTWLPIASPVTNNGYFDWQVPNNPSTRSLVKISDYGSASTYDISNAPFTIVKPQITVVSPNGGESWTGCTNQSITWTKSGVSNYFNIDYSSDNGQTWVNIVTQWYNSSTTASYNWSVANIPSSQFRIRVRDYYASAKDSSNASFSVTSGKMDSLLLTSPNGAELWAVSAVKNITWTSNASVGNVGLQYAIAGGNWTNITASTPNTGTYAWVVPNNASNAVKIKVYSVGTPCVADISDLNFTISSSPTIVVTSPNGGEAWNAGTVKTITWLSANLNSTRVNIDYSTNGGNTWTVVTSDYNNTGTFNWTVPLPLSNTALVRVSDFGNANTRDISNAAFAIVTPKTMQTITFDSIPHKTYGAAAFPLNATATSGLPVTFEVVSGYAYVSNNSLYLTGAGPVTIRANQAGNATYAPAPSVLRTFCVSPNQPSEISGFKTSCVGSTDNYSVSILNGTSYKWTLTGGGLITSANNTAKINWSGLGNFTLKVVPYTTCGDSGTARTALITVQTPQSPGIVGNKLPADNSINLLQPLSFSWSPAPNATAYDLYIWLDSLSSPSTPTISNITQINYTYHGNLVYGATYKWKIVAKNQCLSTDGPFQRFTLRSLPDLLVNKITLPTTAFSGQSLNINWEVKNKGNGGTLSQQWYDAVYLSIDTTLDLAVDTYLGSTPNATALTPNISYNQTAIFTLPQGISGKYYIFIKTNNYQQVLESDFANNLTRSNNPVTVTLTPPPDLVVTTIVPPNNAFSGTDISITWKVSNTGNGATIATKWHDRVLISQDSTLNAANAIILGTFEHIGALEPNTSYTTTHTVKVPESVFGKYYIHVKTDILSQVYEHASESNNSKVSDSISVILSPPADLSITTITLHDTVSSGQQLKVKWTVVNQGAGTIQNTSWTDGIYLSTRPELKMDSALLLAEIGKYAVLSQDDYYQVEHTVKIPSNITGAYYLFVKTDLRNSVYEYASEANNTLRHDLRIVSPDLVVLAISNPPSGVSGQAIQVNWTVKNQGLGKTDGLEIVDRIAIASTPNASPANLIELNGETYTISLLPNGQISKQATVLLPNGISGNHYLSVYTDYKNKIFENINEGNNYRVSSTPIAVTLGPWADFRASNPKSQDTATAGTTIPFQYTIKNYGSYKGGPRWTDKIYISKNKAIDTGSNQVVRREVVSRTLQPDSSITLHTFIKIPAELAESKYYLYVLTDAQNEIYEHTAENNNISSRDSLYILKYPPVDLAVTSFTTATVGASGTQIEASWAVKNLGKSPTLPAFWTDAIYISSDATFDANDQLVKEWRQNGSLAPGSSYLQNKMAFQLPNGISGNFYLFFVTDHKNSNNDNALANNHSNGSPIAISLTPPSDLKIVSFSVPPQGTSGQPLTITWKVTNTGVGTTAATSWTDKAYLSTDFVIDNSDLMIGSSVRGSALLAGQSYTDSLKANIPISASGNYILLLKTDANNDIYEHNAEGNNIIQSEILIFKPLPSDLIVSDIIIPSTAVAGKPVTINWTIKNIGENPVSGTMSEAVYFSEDENWDIKDVLLKTHTNSVNLGPQASASRDLTADLNGVSLKNYYVIVRTDVLNNIFESNDLNNLTTSATQLSVTVPDLALNVALTDNLENGKNLYYKIAVTDSLEDETLLITLKGDSTSGNNEMYVKHGEVPTKVVYDFTHKLPYEGNQEVVVPEMEKGIYYLQVTGTASFSPQKITLLATVLKFGIRSVNAKTGGNTGLVTIEVNGSKLGDLKRLELSANGVVIPAFSIRKIDATKIYATFNLKGALLGDYDVKAINSKAEIALLANGFKVVAGVAPNLMTNVLTPPSTRRSNIVTITINYLNAGNTDLIDPSIQLNSLEGAPLGFSVSELLNNTQDLKLSLFELEGPPGILRPGASGTLVVYSKATNALTFTLLKPNYR